MEIQQARYLQSAVKITDLPKPILPEYAFTGRSNVGKSSLINMLCSRNKLAITSSKPGKTKTINHFIIDDSWYLVDLPGYGFAKVSKKEREKWAAMMKRYVLDRTNLVSVFVLIDMRIEPIESDLDFVNLLGKNGIPFKIVFTKSDKVKQAEISRKINSYKAVLSKTWEVTPDMIVSSSLKKLGKTEILQFIEEGNVIFREAQESAQ